MATEAEVSIYRERFDLEELVKNMMWKELLIELVDSNKLNPWDIDIAVITDKYVQAIRKMKVLDLHVPANIIFAASVLLRMKSELLPVFEDVQEVAPEEGFDAIGAEIQRPEVSGMVFKFRVQPKKKITLEGLMDALDGAMKFQEKREERRLEVPQVQLRIPDEDINKRMESIMKLIKGSVDPYGLTTFAALSNKYDHSGNILTGLFVPMLFLADNSRIAIRQDNFFEEIFIKLKERSESDGK